MYHTAIREIAKFENLSSQQLIEVIKIAYNSLAKILNLSANFFLDLKETSW